MAGLYIHIPFCKQRCHYCNFFSVVSTGKMEPFLEALHKEIALRKDFLSGEPLTTLYLGGGTPSLLGAEKINQLFLWIGQYHEITEGAEITLEANPDDLDKARLRQLADTPVNRLSIGIQSFHDADLHYLNRVHDSHRARKSIEEALGAGFTNLTIDLIYGIPTLSEKAWKENLSVFFSYDLPHLSAYALTVEDRTALAVKIRKGLMAPVDEEKSARHFEILAAETRKRGYIHYEISNFSKPGHYSKHNSLYWSGGNYLGLGPSAHSYNGRIRRWNASNITKYLLLEDYETLESEEEILTLEQRYNEYVMTSLRTIWGCDTAHIMNAFGNDYATAFGSSAEKFIASGLMAKEGSRYFLTDKGKLYADGIASDLFSDE